MLSPLCPPDKDPYPGQCWCQPGTVVMLMSGCGGDITDLARLLLLSNYPAVFTDNYQIIASGQDQQI